MKFIPGPDFPTGGEIIGKEAIRQLYETGMGSLRVQSKGKTEVSSKGVKVIAISELPFALKKMVLIEKLAEQVHSGEYPWILDIRDFSSRDGIRIEIEVRRGYDEQKLFRELRQCQPLEHTIAFRWSWPTAMARRQRPCST